MKKRTRSDISIAFFGTSKLAVYVLEELEHAGLTPDTLVTSPDKPAGRGLEMQSSASKQWASSRDIPVLEPPSLLSPSASLDMLMNSELQLFVVADYGHMIPKTLLDVPLAGTLNVHPSLLPRYRGPSPIISQILADERDVGVTIMLMDEELDHGPILAQASISPDPWPLKASVLGEILMREGGRLLAEVVPDWIDDSMKTSETYELHGGAVFQDPTPTITPEPQDHSKATVTKKINKEEGLIDLSHDAYQNYLKFCAYDEWPGIYFVAERRGKQLRVKVTDAIYENGSFVVKRVIPEGKREMDYHDYLRG